MKNQELQALAAMKTEVSAMTLPCILKRLQREKALVDDELNQMPADSWFNVRARELMNRDQELFTTMRVLERLTTPPKQTLEKVIKRLKAEKALVEDELNQMPADSWFNVRARELMNREQELFTTLRVLEGLAAAPMQVTQITEPAN